MANQLNEFKTAVDELISSGMKKDDAIFNVLKDYIKKSKKIRFEGDGYGDEWKAEAAKRGLTNIPKTPEALEAFVSEKSLGMFEKTNVMSKVEVEARFEIMMEAYQKKIQIESRILGDLAGNHVVPTAIKYQNLLIENVQGLKDILDANTYKKVANEQLEMIKDISNRISEIIKNKEEMIMARKKANKIEDAPELAHAYYNSVLPYFEKIRYHADKLELLIDDELWPLPKLREMLFTR